MRCGNRGGHWFHRGFYLILTQIDKAMHRYLTDVESIILYHYRIDPYTMEQSMTMIDFQLMVQQLTKNQRKNALSGNKVAEALAAVRDILNFITLPDKHKK